MYSKSSWFFSLCFLLFTIFSNHSIQNVNACSEYNLDGLYWSELNLCNSTDSFQISPTKLLSILNYHWVSIFLCTIGLFTAFGISFYFYKRHKYAPSPRITPVNVITISRVSQSENFNEPVSFIQLSSSPPAYANVFTNIAD